MFLELLWNCFRPPLQNSQWDKNPGLLLLSNLVPVVVPETQLTKNVFRCHSFLCFLQLFVTFIPNWSHNPRFRIQISIYLDHHHCFQDSLTEQPMRKGTLDCLWEREPWTAYEKGSPGQPMTLWVWPGSCCWARVGAGQPSCCRLLLPPWSPGSGASCGNSPQSGPRLACD